ncbi:MAG: SOS response-associated peptidase [Thermotogota bacterium]
MCGRFVTYIPLEQIIKDFDIDISLIDDYTPNYNIAPTNEVLAIYEKDTQKTINKFRWGLVPFWADDPSIGYKMINARAETLSERKTYKPLLKNKRCAIVSNGFYEWRTEGNQKIPYYIKLKNDKTFTFAGLYDIWTDDEENKITSCTIITTSPNEKVEQIHDRMPVMLEKEETKKWIRSENNFDYVKNMLTAKKSEEIDLYQVSTKINSPKNNSKSNIIPEKENRLF